MSHLKQRVWLAGATGLVGRALLAQLLQQPVQIDALLRRPVNDLPSSPRLHHHQVDFAMPDLGSSDLAKPDTVFICLGTTLALAGSQAAFRALDLEAVVNVARSARAAGASACAVVSALGADPASRVFYNRTKGEMEQALAALRFDRLVIARPSLLAGNREQLGQARRSGEAWALRLTKPMASLIPAKWRPIQADVLARALILALSQEGAALQVLESDHLQTLGAI
ncbi:NAD(P)H-binding protein [Roseateles oligotrophus]|uniref:NAD(P)H-binding protein n=1 Tax=Roseateles oligotrophus TaxID=1769250 RepID=A0ABT2YA24_9BURK|nr:NAD(P)H-binding protein [Roseateles oligotrophus]MCV2367146.1 NAD(P)H-binding protein [Roseateles oligotrophus]